MRTKSRITVSVAIILALTSAPLLTGCFGNPIQNLVKSASGGKVDLGGNTIPSDFPKSVPLYQGKILTAAELKPKDGNVYNITIVVPDAGALDDISKQLTGAGFKVIEKGSAGKAGASVIASTKDWGVAVIVVKDDNKNGFVANYTVTQIKQNN